MNPKAPEGYDNEVLKHKIELCNIKTISTPTVCKYLIKLYLNSSNLVLFCTLLYTNCTMSDMYPDQDYALGVVFFTLVIIADGKAQKKVFIIGIDFGE
jgi:hypothetical protein